MEAKPYYRVVIGNTAIGLEEKVNKLYVYGYVVHGSLSVLAHDEGRMGTEYRYYQTMVLGSAAMIEAPVTEATQRLGILQDLVDGVAVRQYRAEDHDL